MKLIAILTAALVLSAAPLWAGGAKTCGCEKPGVQCVCEKCDCKKDTAKCCCNNCPTPCPCQCDGCPNNKK